MRFTKTGLLPGIAMAIALQLCSPNVQADIVENFNNGLTFNADGVTEFGKFTWSTDNPTSDSGWWRVSGNQTFRLVAGAGPDASTAASLNYFNPQPTNPDSAVGISHISADGQASTGIYDFSFDYMTEAPEAAGAPDAGDFAARVWGFNGDPLNAVAAGDTNRSGGTSLQFLSAAGFQAGGNDEFASYFAQSTTNGSSFVGLTQLEFLSTSASTLSQPTANNTWQSYDGQIDLGATGYDFLIFSFAGGTTNLPASGQTDASTVRLDNFSFTSTSPIPEPSSFCLFGIAGFAALQRRKRS